MSDNYGTWFDGTTIDGDHIWISSDPYVDSDRQFEVNGEAVKIVGVSRYRDGGTTRVHTERGEFYWPSPLKVQRNSDLKPTWNGVVVEPNR